VYSEYLTNEALESFGDFRIGGQVICTVKYADELVLLAKEETVLQGTEIVRYCGMKMNVEQTKVMRISRQPAPPQKIMIDQKQSENVEYFDYLGSTVTHARCTRELKSRIAVAKATLKM
jgi:hypothetical protein